MNLGFFCPKMAVLWRITVFQKVVCWNPYFYSVLGVRAFWANLSEKGIFGHPPKNKKNLTDNWKAHFLIFSVFVVCLFFLFFVFFGGFKGQVRWPEGPPHLALNPPYLFFCVLFFVFVCFCFFCLFVLFVLFFLVVFSFLSLLLSEKTVFPLKQGIFC